MTAPARAVLQAQAKPLTGSQIQALDRSDMTIGVDTWDHHPVTRYRATDWRVQASRAKATWNASAAVPFPGSPTRVAVVNVLSYVPAR